MFPGMLRKKENKIEDAFQKSLNIPEAEKNFEAVLNYSKYFKTDFSLLRRYVETQKLRQLQKEFFKNVDNPQNSYYYFKVLY